MALRNLLEAKTSDQDIQVIDDPLTLRQKRRVIDFAYRYLHALLNTDQPYFSNHFRHLLPTPAFANLDRREKTRLLQQANDATGSVSFFDLINAYNHPQLQARAFGIDPNNVGQINAARLLIQATFEADYQRRNKPDSYAPALTQYQFLCCSVDDNEPETKYLTPQQALILKNQPLQALDPNQADLSWLDILLSRTYFQEHVRVAAHQADTETQRSVIATNESEKERQRQLYILELSRLFREENTRHMMQALAACLHQSNGHLLFSSKRPGIGSLAYPFPDEMGGLNFEAKNYLIASSIFDTNDATHIRVHARGVIVHEGLHYIFKNIVQNRSAPVRPEGEADFDHAIRQDQEHRRTLDQSQFSEADRYAWTWIVDHLEKSKTYQSSLVYSQVPQHKMRSESIVRPMQLLAEDIPEASIQKVMPNVYRFYQEHSRPLLERHVQACPLNNPVAILTAPHLQAAPIIVAPQARLFQEAHPQAEDIRYQIENLCNTLEKEIDALKPKTIASSIYCFFGEYEISTKVKKLNCLRELQNAANTTEMKRIATTALQDSRINRGFRNTSTAEWGRSRTTDLLRQIRRLPEAAQAAPALASQAL